MTRLVVNILSGGVALSLGAATPALAQDHPGDASHADQHTPDHVAPKPVAKPEARPEVRRAPAVVHKTVVHNTVVRKQVNEHVTERVDQHVNEHVVDRGPVGHPGGAPGARRWASGQRFYGDRVVFRDYGRYHLRQPPPGYEWVDDNGELVMISIETGLIADIFFLAAH